MKGMTTKSGMEQDAWTDRGLGWRKNNKQCDSGSPWRTDDKDGVAMREKKKSRMG